MVFFYIALTMIISIEVTRRYLTGSQTQWGSTVSIYCFIWLSWLGCAYHVRLRSHLRFEAVRSFMPRFLKLLCYILDDVLWLVLASVILVTAWQLVEAQIRLGNVIEGTDSIPMVVATAAVPFGWSLIVIRALQDIFTLIQSYRRGESPDVLKPDP